MKLAGGGIHDGGRFEAPGCNPNVFTSGNGQCGGDLLLRGMHTLKNGVIMQGRVSLDQGTLTVGSGATLTGNLTVVGGGDGGSLITEDGGSIVIKTVVPLLDPLRGILNNFLTVQGSWTNAGSYVDQGTSKLSLTDAGGQINQGTGTIVSNGRFETAAKAYVTNYGEMHLAGTYAVNGYFSQSLGSLSLTGDGTFMHNLDNDRGTVRVTGS